ncbi:MAG TPA: fructose-1,6-bisphosphatase [Epulopiscium sp.]|nr:fructose-1,6-bisphosphatase [Candidatus Epulonipiscium sp.]
MQNKYLELLAKSYPDISSVTTEIINLQAILHLPKGTEHFITDIHGENEQFQHVLRNASGAIKRKIEEEFSYELSMSEKKELAMLVYYPRFKLRQDKNTGSKKEREDWKRISIYRLVILCKNVSSKYTRSKVRKALPPAFAYIMEELMTGHPEETNQKAYYDSIITEVIRVERADELIIALCNLIRRLAVDHLHVIGDIYDRGPYPHIIMDTLMKYHSVDIQWGNHDVLWMGAAAGNTACIANVIRISARYGNLRVIEEGYGINLVPLVKLAMKIYSDDPCNSFKLNLKNTEYKEQDTTLDEKIHKAITIIQFKLEGRLINQYPEFEMENRNLLDKIDLENGQVLIDGNSYPLNDTNFPTINWQDPYALSVDEKIVVKQLENAFLQCEKLQKHVHFLYTKGSLYKKYNGNLLFHGCVPMNSDGSFKDVMIFGHKYSGRQLYDILEQYARKGYYAHNKEDKKNGQAILWFIWISKDSPVYGKEKMATFERYFLDDPEIKVENKNPYYDFVESEEVINDILREFGLDEDGAHIVNGHMPVKVKKGESPVKCNGKLLMIDGGFSKAYQKITGIAGYTLIYNSYGLILAAHELFESMEKAVLEGKDILSHTVLVEQVSKRKMVKDTDIGERLKTEIEQLEELLRAYRSGSIIEA